MEHYLAQATKVRLRAANATGLEQAVLVQEAEEWEQLACLAETGAPIHSAPGEVAEARLRPRARGFRFRMQSSS